MRAGVSGGKGVHAWLAEALAQLACWGWLVPLLVAAKSSSQR
jgi:hypothetical protein